MARRGPQNCGMRFAFFCFALLLATSARADAFYKLGGYQCDTKAGRLTLTYDAAANSAGEAMLRAKTPQQGDPWDLVHGEGEGITSTTTVRGTCQLSDGVYDVELGPVPGNVNPEGRCSAWMSAWAEVRRGKTIVWPRADFERGVACSYDQGEIITRVEISPGRRPRMTKHSAESLLSGT